jgi:Zn-dependent M28 family amino/carboxypeptidase
MILAAAFLLCAFAAWFFLLRMPGESHEEPLPPLDADQIALRGELEADVRHLADEIGERNTRHPEGLEAAARFVERGLSVCGAPKRHEYEIGAMRCANVEVEIAGGSRASEIVIVGAHYDSVPGCPGANDNATGAAGVLAVARRFAGTKPARTLRFVEFVNEEPPWFQTEHMGSVRYAKRCKERGENVVAMLCLETLGCFRTEEGSQKYPAPGLSLCYPSRGDFVVFVGNVASRALTREAVGAFRGAAAFPSEGAALPSWIPGVDWSDHWSFWEEGVPAVMVTDTAPFRYEQYHTPADTPDRVDFDRLARVVDGLEAVVGRFANPGQ